MTKLFYPLLLLATALWTVTGYRHEWAIIPALIVVYLTCAWSVRDNK